MMVQHVNQPPTLDPIERQTVAENSTTPLIVPLAGITAGPADESDQTLRFSTNLDPQSGFNATVNYIQGQTMGTLAITPLPGVSGFFVVNVTVVDSGGTDFGGVNTSSESFALIVPTVNQPTQPTLASIPDLPLAGHAPILQSVAPLQQTVPLSFITDGPGGTSPVTVTATSDNPGLIPNTGAPGGLAVTYFNPDPSGSLTFTPVASASGTADIAVTVTDTLGFSVQKSFKVTVAPFTLPLGPSLIGQSPATGAGEAEAVAVAGTLAYVAGTQAIDVVDISGP